MDQIRSTETSESYNTAYWTSCSNKIKEPSLSSLISSPPAPIRCLFPCCTLVCSAGHPAWEICVMLILSTAEDESSNTFVYCRMKICVISLFVAPRCSCSTAAPFNSQLACPSHRASSFSLPPRVMSSEACYYFNIRHCGWSPFGRLLLWFYYFIFGVTFRKILSLRCRKWNSLLKSRIKRFN